MDISPNQSSTQFLTTDESAQVDAALLSSPEKFLTRLTISSLRILQHIATEYDVPIEELTVKQIITWFELDAKIRREKGVEEAFLKW
ncbi:MULTISPECIES: hypothetical protein [Sphaerospermopsis]|jgi:hypothetical protein|uniref:Uncharacterized protein n=1 Tax=Sphaerospermopsis torques-reginae ITEP-024 TaxID=984208 RepID=A0ABX8WW73_9CYAN|nr:MULTISPECIES: hypothetical protein [Sphaerospermopsis]MBE9056280.1 hypothetical protein [Sphaerospermopsis sp. LEGE 08334]QYX30672.1 hypothetical protein K2F26_17550 [Sphaerospermopsis torques-reginae ITEP-024]